MVEIFLLEYKQNDLWYNTETLNVSLTHRLPLLGYKEFQITGHKQIEIQT